MIKNLIDVELPLEVEEQAIQNIRNTEGLFTFLIGLSTDERKKLTKIGKRSLDFVERSLMHAKENKGLIPSYVGLDEFDRDYRLMVQLRRITALLDSLSSKIKDTYIQTGAEAYSSAREFYNAVKRASGLGVMGCDVIERDLSARFKRQTLPDNETPEEPVVTVSK